MNEDDEDYNSDSTPPVPPLPPTHTTLNARRFRDGNTARIDGVNERKRKLEENEMQEHPISKDEYTKVLKKKKRIPEDQVDVLKIAMVQYLHSIKDDLCYDVKSNSVLQKCNCLKTILNEDGKLHAIAEMVANYYNLPAGTREGILSKAG